MKKDKKEPLKDMTFDFITVAGVSVVDSNRNLVRIALKEKIQKPAGTKKKKR